MGRSAKAGTGCGEGLRLRYVKTMTGWGEVLLLGQGGVRVLA